MAKTTSGALDRVERELDRIGLLLQHDAQLPSVTAIVAGEPIRGSWWGHPRGHEIFELLHEFSERSGGLAAKIVNAKITYVHPRLWPAFLKVVHTQNGKTTDGLSKTAVALRQRVLREGVVRADDLRISDDQPAREVTKAIRELESRLLVHSESVHTESGAHEKVLQSWDGWAAAHGCATPTLSLESAKTELAEAVDRLARDATRKPKLPW